MDTVLLRREGRPDQAVIALDEALELHRALSDRYQEGLILHRLGLAYADAGDNLPAVDCFEQALAIRTELGDEHGVTETNGERQLRRPQPT